MIKQYDSKRKSLLRDFIVNESETVTVNTTSNLHLTAEHVLTAPELCSKKRFAALTLTTNQLLLQNQRLVYSETPTERVYLLQLSSGRNIQAEILRWTRIPRRQQSTARIAAKTVILCSTGSFPSN